MQLGFNDDKKVITEGSAPYVWVIKNMDTLDVYLYYDGETAREFASNLRKTTGDKICIDTQNILDMYIPEKNTKGKMTK